MKKIAIGADHAGFDMKEFLKSELAKNNYEVSDFGTHSADSVDYPDFAHPVATAVEKGEADSGILVCGSGQGMAITANKHQGIRAALCWLPEIAQLSREHNNANVLCLPARFVTHDKAAEMMRIFLETPFEAGRHQRRVEKISCS